MAQLPRSLLRLADLATRKPTSFDMQPGAGECGAVAQALDIMGVKKLSFAGTLSPSGKTDWHLHARLGATVVQACVISLEPVTTRLEEDVRRTYVADLPEVAGAEIETPEDDSIEPLPATLDLVAVMLEALALALPAFPKAPGANLGAVVHTEPGAAPMTDDEAKPFAGLRDALNRKEDKTN